VESYGLERLGCNPAGRLLYQEADVIAHDSGRVCTAYRAGSDTRPCRFGLA
jgi:hypothetical protein